MRPPRALQTRQSAARNGRSIWGDFLVAPPGVLVYQAGGLEAGLGLL